MGLEAHMASWFQQGRRRERREGHPVHSLTWDLLRGRESKPSYLLSSGGLGNSQGDTEDGIGTQLALVWGTIELDQELIDLGLVLDINVLLDQGRADDLVDVLNGLGDTLSAPLGLVLVTELNSFVLTWMASVVSLSVQGLLLCIV